MVLGDVSERNSRPIVASSEKARRITGMKAILLLCLGRTPVNRSICHWSSRRIHVGRIKQSVAWWCYVRGEMTPERLVRAAAEIGYDAVELVEPAYWQLVKDHGLAIAS